jgi:hypothetical protein
MFLTRDFGGFEEARKPVGQPAHGGRVTTVTRLAVLTTLSRNAGEGRGPRRQTWGG